MAYSPFSTEINKRKGFVFYGVCVRIVYMSTGMCVL